MASATTNIEDSDDDEALLVVAPASASNETGPQQASSARDKQPCLHRHRETPPVKRAKHWKKLKALNQFYQQIQRWLAKIFFNLGWSLATRPWAYLVSCTFICAILAAGCLNLTFDDDITLWYPRNSGSYKDYLFRNDVFGLDNSTATAVATLQHQPFKYTNGTYENQGILTHAALEEVKSLYLALSTARLEDDRNYSYSSYFCARNCALRTVCHCKVNSIFSVFAVLNSSTPTQEPDIILPSSNVQILDQIISRPLTSNVPVLETVLGGLQYANGEYSDSGELTFADAAMLRFELSDKADKFDMTEWESLFRETCVHASENFTIISVACETDNEQTLETDQALADDQLFIVIAMTFMIAYVTLVLGKWDCVNSRYSLCDTALHLFFEMCELALSDA